MTAHGKRVDMLVHEQDPFNAESAAPALAEANPTALDVFYVRSDGPVPAPDPAGWRLRVDGLVERELEVNLDQLRSRFQAHTRSSPRCTRPTAGKTSSRFATFRARRPGARAPPAPRPGAGARRRRGGRSGHRGKRPVRHVPRR
jgi:hypothetical protein